MNKIRKQCLQIPISQLKFRWFAYDQKEICYPPERNWLFIVHGPGFKTEEVISVELPKLDYRSIVKDPIVKIYTEHVYEDKEGEWDYENLEE